jgi:hypothetical protein
MIVFVTTPDNQSTVHPLVTGELGEALPVIRVAHYDGILSRTELFRATFVFADIERLAPWEQRLAAAAYRDLRAAGLTCLNDPARIMGRFELLRTLHRAGINPFNVYRAEDDPKPARFPVFIRGENDHGPTSALIGDQSALDRELVGLRDSGTPLRGLLVIELCAEPVMPGVWRKFGTFRVRRDMHVDHAVLEDNWHVKYGKVRDDYPYVLFEQEHDAIIGNHCAPEITRAFDLSGIEYGRADHGAVEGRQVIYEINTNPTIGLPAPQTRPIREHALAAARRRLAALMWGIDSGDGSPITIETGPILAAYREQNKGRRWPIRP